MTFVLHADHVKRLCEINCFPIPKEEMVFFGLRGCLPTEEDNHAFQAEHQLMVESCNYRHPRCTIGQWLPKEKMIAVFPGSTVPHERHVMSSLARNGRGTNQMMTGLYQDYRKGIHLRSKSTGHEAFRQNSPRPIRRTADDTDYDADDRVEVVNPGDNLHAGWSMGVNGSYASAGCQVVLGFPKCVKRGDADNVGPWKTFKEYAYGLKQESFPYILLYGRDAHKVALDPTKKTVPRPRYGSAGALVKRAQKALQKAGYYEGKIDGDFGPRTMRAVLAYQESTFGPQGDDGIVGPITAHSLGIDLGQV